MSFSASWLAMEAIVFYFVEIPVLREVRERFVKEYPLAARDIAVMRLAQYILFGARFLNTGEVIVPYELLAAMEGKQKLARQNKYCGRALLERYRQCFPGAWFTEADFREGRARAVAASGLPDYVTLGDPRREDCAFFASGRVASEAGVQRETQRLKRQVRADAAATYPVTRALVEQSLNCRKSTYGGVEERIDAAYRASMDLSASKREHAHRILKRIELDPVQRLCAPPISARAFDVTPTYQQLPSVCRHALFDGCYELDLKSAQLAIIAKLWDIPLLQEFLAEGQCIWTEIANAYQQPLHPSFKATVKDAMYATAYGAGRNKVNEVLTDGAIPPEPFNKMELIRAIRKGRRTNIHGLTRNGKARIGNRTFTVTEENVLTILAAQAQYEEQILIEPALQLGRDTQNTRAKYAVLAYTFDGIIVTPRRDTNPETIIKEAKKSVQRTAIKKKFYTRLESKKIRSRY